MKISTKDESIKNKGALTTLTVERITREIAVAAKPGHVAVTTTKNVTGIERRLQELSDTINECVHAQKEENQRFWNYLMHLENHMHQFAVYIKKKNKDFPDSLLQPFNFQASVGDAPAAEATAESKEESKSKEEPPPS